MGGKKSGDWVTRPWWVKRRFFSGIFVLGFLPLCSEAFFFKRKRHLIKKQTFFF